MNLHHQKSAVESNDSSYRVFHITKRSPDQSDDDDENLPRRDEQINRKDQNKNRRFSKKSFRRFQNNWKRKSSKTKLSSPARKTSNPSANRSSSSINLADPTTIHLLNNDPDGELFIETFEQTLVNDDATLHDLLARADQLENKLQKQDFNKIQPTIVHGNFFRRRKAVWICLGIFSLIFIGFLVGAFFLLREFRH